MKFDKLVEAYMQVVEAHTPNAKSNKQYDWAKSLKPGNEVWIVGRDNNTIRGIFKSWASEFGDGYIPMAYITYIDSENNKQDGQVDGSRMHDGTGF